MRFGISSWHFDDKGIYHCKYCGASYEPGHSVTCEKQSHLTESCRLGEFPNFNVDKSTTLFTGLKMMETNGN